MSTLCTELLCIVPHVAVRNHVCARAAPRVGHVLGVRGHDPQLHDAAVPPLAAASLLQVTPQQPGRARLAHVVHLCADIRRRVDDTVSDDVHVKLGFFFYVHQYKKTLN